MAYVQLLASDPVGAGHSHRAPVATRRTIRSTGWYVNLQEPLRRSRLGFDTDDLILDIWVQPGGSWSLEGRGRARGGVTQLGRFTDRRGRANPRRGRARARRAAVADGLGGLATRSGVASPRATRPAGMWSERGRRRLAQPRLRARALRHAAPGRRARLGRRVVLWLAGRDAGEDLRRPAAARARAPRRRRLVAQDKVWEGEGVLKLHRFGTHHSIWHLREAGWYVNLEEPWRASSLGWDTRDLALDIVVSRDGSWRWKDEDHLSVGRGARLDHFGGGCRRACRGRARARGAAVADGVGGVEAGSPLAAPGAPEGLGCGLGATASPCARSGTAVSGRRGRGSWCRTSPTCSCSGFRRARERWCRRASPCSHSETGPWRRGASA